MEQRNIILSGIQPSGKLTLGNYLGAVSNWVSMQEHSDCIYCIADLHAITVRQEAAELRRQTLEAYAGLLACGIDPEKSTVFIQSHVPAHTELTWVLSCFTMFGELSRMTQFKDKSQRHPDNINAGLFTYPVLQAADILLYQPNQVPVGVDQKQHVELTRDIAARFNGVYGDVFTLPEPYIPELGAKIMSLAEPDRKMSKSDSNPGAYILLSDKPDDIMRKFKRAVTDSDARVIYGEDNYGVRNLISIYSLASGKTTGEIEREFDGKGYGEFKAAVGEAVVSLLSPVRERSEELLKNKDYLQSVYRSGAEKAARRAGYTLDKVYKKLGFVK